MTKPALYHERPTKSGAAGTAVQRVMTGTFTRPMPVAGGKPIAPTNKPYRLDMGTIGRWEDGVMKGRMADVDNQAFMKQIGLRLTFPSEIAARAPRMVPVALTDRRVRVTVWHFKSASFRSAERWSS